MIFFRGDDSDNDNGDNDNGTDNDDYVRKITLIVFDICLTYKISDSKSA